MHRLILPALSLLAVCSTAACATADVRVAGDTDVSCIHRLYDYPSRAVPFQIAAGECAGNRTVDLTGDRYYQVLARSLNLPFVNHDPQQDHAIALTGSRIPQSTDIPAPPQLSLR